MQNRLFTLVAALAFVACVSSVAVADEKLAAIEKDLAKVWTKMESMSADITMAMSMQGMTNNGKGTVEFVQKSGKQLFRMDMKSEMEMSGQKMTADMSSISDGEFVYTVNDMNGQKMAMKNKPGAGQMSPPVGEDMFKSLKEQNELKVLPDETVDGDVAYVIQATPKQAMGAPIATMKMYFVKKTGIMAKMIGTDASGAEVMSMHYKNVKFNKKIDDSRFVFKAPEGVQVMDMTGQ